MCESGGGHFKFSQWLANCSLFLFIQFINQQ